MSTANPTFASLLGETDPRAGEALRRLRRHALIPLAIAGSLLIDVVDARPALRRGDRFGRVKVELNRKTVQHQEGGIVRQILVRDGDRVTAGQPLIVIGDVRNDAELTLLQDQLVAERIRYARASAESTLAASFQAPADTLTQARRVSRSPARRALFDSRRRTLDEQVTSLNAQVHDAQGQATALARQIESIDTSAKLASEELALNEKLVSQGFVQRARLLQLQRDAADYRSHMSEAQSELSSPASAPAKYKRASRRPAISISRWPPTKRRSPPATSANWRSDSALARSGRAAVRARAGRRQGHGPSRRRRLATSLRPREPLLDVVPTREKLVIEAHIRPQDINHVREGSVAEVRLSAFSARSTPLLTGAVTFVSPDLVTSPTNDDAWFTATVEVDATALASSPGMQLQAGMPAELYVTTPARTLFQYLAKPFTSFTSRAMREP